MGYITRPPYSNTNRLKIIRSNKFTQDIKFVLWDMPELKRTTSSSIVIEHNPITFEITNSLIDDPKIHFIAKVQVDNISEPHPSYENIQQTANSFEKLNAINVGNALANYYEYWGYTNDMGMYFDENGKGYAGGFHIQNFGTTGKEYALFRTGTRNDSIASFYNQDLYNFDNTSLFVGYSDRRTSREFNSINDILSQNNNKILRFADWMELCMYQFKTACDARNLCYPAFFTLDVEDGFPISSIIDGRDFTSGRRNWLDIIRNNSGSENPNRWNTAKIYEEWDDAQGIWKSVTWASAFQEAYGTSTPQNPYNQSKAYFQGYNRDAMRKLTFIGERIIDYMLDKIYYQPARRYFPRIICGNYGTIVPISGKFGVYEGSVVYNAASNSSRDPVITFPYGEKGFEQSWPPRKQIKADLQNPVAYTCSKLDGLLSASAYSYASTGFENNTQITAFTRGVNSATILYVFGILSNGLGSIARYDGTSWVKIADVRQLDGTPGIINAAVVFNGRIFFAGNFTTIIRNDGSTITCSNIASFNDDTNVDTINFTSHATSCNGQIRALAVHALNNLYIGGDFTAINGATFNRIARLNFTNPNYTYNPIIVGTTNGIDSNPAQQSISSVFCFLLNGAILYVGGSFTTINGISHNRITSYNITTNTWSTLGTGLNNTVRCLALYKNRIYAGGDFTNSGISARIAFYALIDNASQIWSGVGLSSTQTSIGLNLSVNTLQTATIGGVQELYIGGDFTQTTSNLSMNRFAKIADNNFLTSILPTSNTADYKAGVNAVVNAITTYSVSISGQSINYVVLGGGFSDITSVGSFQTANLLATWNGNSYGKFTDIFDATVNCSCIYNYNNKDYLVVGGKFITDFNRKSNLIVGGNFTTIDGSTVNRLGSYDGVSWSALGTGTNGVINASLVLANGNLVVAGDFTLAGGVSCNNIAIWNGSSWSALGTGIVNGVVNALAVLNNGNIVAAGTFTLAGGSTINRIAQWNGTVWSGFGTGISSASATVNALAVLPNGNIIAGGSFTTAGGVAVNNIAQWNGTSWSGLASGTNGAVNAMIVESSGSVIVGGSFTTASVLTVNRIARWNGSWNAIVANGMNNTVNALAILANGNIVAGGTFTSAGGVSVNRIAQWNGSVWSPIGSGMGNNAVTDLALLPNWNLVAGGTFTTAGGVTVNGLARWNGTEWIGFGNGPNATTSFTFASIPISTSNNSFYKPANNIAMCLLPAANSTTNTDATNWMRLNGGTIVENNINGTVHAVAQFGADLFVGGNFTSVNNSLTNEDSKIENSYIVKWNGTAWSYLNIDSNNTKAKLNGIVYCIFVHTVDVTSTLYVGGAFTSTSDDARVLNRIAKFNTTTSEWDQVIVAGGVGFNNTVYTIGVDQHNNLIIGGEFTANGNNTSTYNRVAKYNGSAFVPLGFGFANGAIRAISFYTENIPTLVNQPTYLVVAGSFTEAYVTYTSINENTKKPIGKIAIFKNNTWDGMADGYCESHGSNKAINALVKIPTFAGFAAAGELLLGGEFTKWNERIIGSSLDETYIINANGIAHYNFNKSHFASLRSSQTAHLPDDNGINGAVHAFAIAPSSRYIYVVGSMTRCLDVAYNKVVRLYYEPRSTTSRISPRYTPYFYADPAIASNPLTGGVSGIGGYSAVNRDGGGYQLFYEYQYYGRDRKTIWQGFVRQLVKSCLANNNKHEVVPWILCPLVPVSDFYAEQYFPNENDFLDILKDFYKLGIRNFYVFNSVHANQGPTYQNYEVTSPITFEKKKLDKWMLDLLQKFDTWIINFDNDNSVTKRVFRGRGRVDALGQG